MESNHQEKWNLIRMLSAAVMVFVGGACLLYMSADTATAAERVLDPDRVYTAPTPQSIEPLLREGENMRSGTRYGEKTQALLVTESDVHRGDLVLVNYANVLPEDYRPEGLADAAAMTEALGETDFSVTKTGMEINGAMAEKLVELVSDAWTLDGVSGYLLQSGHRDFVYQAALHQRKIQEDRNMGFGEEDAMKAAAFWVARPRESEHHTGLAMDISSRSFPELQLAYAQTANGIWLSENCWRYGFVIRYQEDKSDITGIGFEPWHIRYTGLPHSGLMRQKAWCLEEYMAFLEEEGGVTYRDEGGRIWQIDYQTPMADMLAVPVNQPYTWSGDGKGGYVVTTVMEQP